MSLYYLPSPPVVQHIRVVFNSHSFNKCAAKTPSSRFHSECANTTWVRKTQYHCLTTHITLSTASLLPPWRHFCSHLSPSYLMDLKWIFAVWFTKHPGHSDRIRCFSFLCPLYTSFSSHSALSLLVCLPFSAWRFLEPWTSNAEAWIFLLKAGLLSSTICTFHSFPFYMWNQLLRSLLLRKLTVVRFTVETAGNQSPRLA